RDPAPARLTASPTSRHGQAYRRRSPTDSDESTMGRSGGPDRAPAARRAGRVSYVGGARGRSLHLAAPDGDERAVERPAAPARRPPGGPDSDAPLRAPARALAPLRRRRRGPHSPGAGRPLA